MSGGTPHSSAATLNAAMLAVGSLILGVIVSLAYRERVLYKEIRANALDTRAVLDTLGRIQTDLLEAEAGQRGYLLTGLTAYLEPYNRATPRIPGDLKKLDALLAGHGSSSQLADLNALVNEYQSELQRTLDLRNSKGAGAAREALQTGRARHLMDGIRAAAATIRETEQAILNEFRSQAELASLRALQVTCIGCSVLLVLLWVGNAAIRRGILTRERAFDEARDAHDLLRITLASIGDAVMTTDAAGRVSYLNPVAERLTGWTAAEAASRPLEDVFRIIDESTRVLIDNPVARAMRDGVVVGLTTHSLLIGRNGTDIPIDDSAAPIRGHDGTVLGAVLVFRDLGERRRMERELQESTARLHAALDAGGMGIWDWDVPSGRFRWSPIMEAMHGFPPGGFGGTPEDVLRNMHPEDLPTARKSLDLGLANVPDPYEIEYRVVWPDGSVHWIHGTGQVLADSTGAAVGLAGLCMDVTARKEAERQRVELMAQERTLATERALREAEAELARITRALTVGELAVSIAHEVNQPLAGVATNAEAGIRWLSGASPNVPEAIDSLGLIVRDAHRASEVIRRIRDFLKKEHQITARVDVNEIIREAVALAGAEISRHGIELRLDLAAGLAPVRGDRIQLQQVMLNLIINASEAMATVTDRPRRLVLASRESEEGGVAVSVQDSGIGLRTEEMRGMFEAFVTTKPTGMGLGLSLSRSLIEGHGGLIWAEQNVDFGLTMRFVLPAETVGRQSRTAGASS